MRNWINTNAFQAYRIEKGNLLFGIEPQDLCYYTLEKFLSHFQIVFFIKTNLRLTRLMYQKYVSQFFSPRLVITVFLFHFKKYFNILEFD